MSKDDGTQFLQTPIPTLEMAKMHTPSFKEKSLPFNLITVLYNHIYVYRKQSQQNFAVLNNYVLTLKYNSQSKCLVPSFSVN